jgi:hypothetical protein
VIQGEEHIARLNTAIERLEESLEDEGLGYGWIHVSAEGETYAFRRLHGGPWCFCIRRATGWVRLLQTSLETRMEALPAIQRLVEELREEPAKLQHRIEGLADAYLALRKGSPW